MMTRRLVVLAALPALLLSCTTRGEPDPEPLPSPAATASTPAEDAAGPEPQPAGAPNIPDVATARTELAELTVAAEGPMTDYERELFPHWSTEDGCSTREKVLERDGTDVTLDEDCYPASGTWYSPYDDVTLDAPAEVDIDHVVPLAEAWRSGADTWSTDRREDFANDLEYPELLATSADSNRSKGDQDPANWLPMDSFHCTYALMWVRTKHHWELTIDEAEHAALEELLNTCPATP